MYKKLTTMTGLLVVLVMLLGSCSPAPAAAPAEATAPGATQGEVFKLGIQGPFSGPSAQIGTEMKNGAVMAFEEINWTIGDYKIEPVWIDCQSDPAKATQAYEQAVGQNKIQAGLLNWHSSVAVALMEVTAKYKIPHILGTGSTELVNTKYHSDVAKYGYWTMKSWPVPTKLSVMYVEALEDAIEKGTFKPEKKTVVIYAEDTDLGRTVGNGFKAQFEAEGWEVLDQEYFPLGQTEFYPLLNKFKELDPAVIAGTSTSPPSLAAFIKQADEVGLKGVIIADGLGWIGDWYDLTGKSSNLVLDMIPTWASEPGKKFAKDFEAKYGYSPSASTGGIGYDAAKMWIEISKAAIAESGSLTSETLFKFIKDNVETGKWSYKNGIVMKEYKWGEDTPDPVIGAEYYTFPVLQYFDGVGKVIYPPDWAEQEIKFKE